MKEKDLKGKITRHKNEMVRMKKRADKAYALYKAGDNEQYGKAQYYYQKVAEEKKMYEYYLDMQKKGEYIK